MRELLLTFDLIVENAAKVLAIWEHIGLTGEIGSARIDQINTWKVVLLCNFLSAQVLLHSHGVIGASLDGGIVSNNKTFDAIYTANTYNKCVKAGVFDVF